MDDTSRRTNNMIACVALGCLCICLTTILGLSIATLVYVEDIDDRVSLVENNAPTPSPTVILGDGDIFGKRNVLGNGVQSAKKSPGNAALAVISRISADPPAKKSPLDITLKSNQIPQKTSESTVALAIDLLHAAHKVASRARKTSSSNAHRLAKQLSEDEESVMAHLKTLKKSIGAHNRRATVADLKKIHDLAASISHTLHALKGDVAAKLDDEAMREAHDKAVAVYESTTRLLQAL